MSIISTWMLRIIESVLPDLITNLVIRINYEICFWVKNKWKKKYFF